MRRSFTKKKSYQNQYVEDPKNKCTKVQTLSSLKCESKELFGSEKKLATENVTFHMYETIDECSGYENCQPEAVKLTHPREEGQVKQNIKCVEGSDYLFYNVMTHDPSNHASGKVCNVEILDRKAFHRDFHSYRRSKSHHIQYENCRSFRIVKNQ